LKRTKIEAYLNQFVRPVFDRLVTELLGAMPEDMVATNFNIFRYLGQWTGYNSKEENYYFKAKVL
jgi:hypothetical protein